MRDAEIAGLLALMIPITAIVLGIGLAGWSMYWDHQKKRLQYQERQLMIEKGLVPPPILLEDKHTTTPEASLRRGTILFFLGLGFIFGYFAFGLGTDEELRWFVGMAGTILAFLGLGNFAYYFMARRKQDVIAGPL